MTIEHRAETGSTNDDLRAAAKSGAAEGLWIRADRQNEGRGRLGRDWVSPPGNLYASTLIRLRSGDPPPATLALVAAVALAELVGAYTGYERLRIKWPNDLLLRNEQGWAKLSGILLERVDDAVIVGVGLNLAHHPRGLGQAATSLAAAVGIIADPTSFCEELAAAFARWVARWRNEGLGAIRARWMEHAHPIGTALSVRLGDGGVREGLFEGLDPDGSLLLGTASWTTTVAAGDVALL